MTYAELIFELKRLASLAEDYNLELADELFKLLSEHEEPKGDCCG
jgi:hypothetical protein